MIGNHSDTTISESPADRLISAAQPALAAELHKILDELRTRIESEADIKVKKALVEKEVEHKAALERLRQSVAAEAEAKIESQLAEARAKAAEAEAGLQSKLDDERKRMAAEHQSRLEKDLASRLAALTKQKEAEAAAAAETWNEQQMALERELERWRTLAEYLNKLGESSSQLEILRRFLMSGSRFASSVAVYLQKQDGLALWKTEGEPIVFPNLTSGETVDPDWFYSNVVVRGKTVAAVCAVEPTDREALVVMVAALKRTVENFGLRLRFMASEAKPAEQAANGGPAGEPAANPAPAIEMPAEPAIDADDPRRVARALVAEIKLAHEKEVLEGRVNGDLYQRLRAPIDEGRKVYRSRVDPESGTDYFHEEVVKILADNVVSRLGAEYPGPR